MKIVLPEQNGWPYAEFFLTVNSVRKQVWVSEKSEEAAESDVAPRGTIRAKGSWSSV